MQLSSAIVPPSDFKDGLRPEALFGAPVTSLEVDVGCGKGRFLLARAKANPGIHFVGLDRLIKRLRMIDAKILRDNVPNVRLLYVDAAYMLQVLLPPASVSMFHIFFPDPWPKRRHHKNRLFSPSFLDSLDRTLAQDGQINIATDHLDYFAVITALMRRDARFVEAPAFQPAEEERTGFEITFLKLGCPIGRCSFRKAPAQR